MAQLFGMLAAVRFTALCVGQDEIAFLAESRND